MSFHLWTDEYGWLKSYTRSFAQAKVDHTWTQKFSESYRGPHIRELCDLQIPNAAILEERG